LFHTFNFSYSSIDFSLRLDGELIPAELAFLLSLKKSHYLKAHNFEGAVGVLLLSGRQITSLLFTFKRKDIAHGKEKSST
jgi:hypothetical protein